MEVLFPNSQLIGDFAIFFFLSVFNLRSPQGIPYQISLYTVSLVVFHAYCFESVHVLHSNQICIIFWGDSITKTREIGEIILTTNIPKYFTSTIN